jgi:hypothetical protein
VEATAAVIVAEKLQWQAFLSGNRCDVSELSTAGTLRSRVSPAKTTTDTSAGRTINIAAAATTNRRQERQEEGDRVQEA